MQMHCLVRNTLNRLPPRTTFPMRHHRPFQEWSLWGIMGVAGCDESWEMKSRKQKRPLSYISQEALRQQFQVKRFCFHESGFSKTKIGIFHGKCSAQNLSAGKQLPSPPAGGSALTDIPHSQLLALAHGPLVLPFPWCPLTARLPLPSGPGQLLPSPPAGRTGPGHAARGTAPAGHTGPCR